VLIAGGGSSATSAEVFNSAPDVAAAGGVFGDQTVGKPSPGSVIVITNVGAQTLSISGDAITPSAHSADFAITADACSGRTLAFEQSCTITTQFTPSTTTGETASIALSDNEPTPSSITLTGTGVARNSGPTGPTGPTGTSGPAGSAGTSGTNGAAGPAGPAGKIELVTCRSVKTQGKTVKKCSTSLTSKPVQFTTSEAVRTATLSRGDVIYATGSAILAGKRAKLLLTPLRNMKKGRYTLTLTRGHNRHRETITIS
jgi:hypothetical protein